MGRGIGKGERGGWKFTAGSEGWEGRVRVLALRKGKVSLIQWLTTKDDNRERWVVALWQKDEFHSVSVRVECWNVIRQAVVLYECECKE